MSGLCQWATCKAPANAFEDGWRFCSCHLGEHRAFKREEAEAEIREVRRRKRRNMSLRAAIVALHAEDLSDALIAERLAVSYDVVKRERHQLGLRPKPNPRTVASGGHGTHAGFNSHRARGEDPCDECRAGERLYQRDRGRVRRLRQREAA